MPIVRPFEGDLQEVPGHRPESLVLKGDNWASGEGLLVVSLSSQIDPQVLRLFFCFTAARAGSWSESTKWQDPPRPSSHPKCCRTKSRKRRACFIPGPSSGSRYPNEQHAESSPPDIRRCLQANTVSGSMQHGTETRASAD